MAVPDYQTLMLPVLESLADGATRSTVPEITEVVAARFHLTQEDLDERISTSGCRRAEPIGYRALDALRMEKGYRYNGTDLTMPDTPYEAGLGPFVRLEAGPFIGREALAETYAAGSDRRRWALVIGGSDYEPIDGGEAVRLDGDVIGRHRSVA